jgi:hypothetical protein
MSKPFLVLVLVLLAKDAFCQQSGYLVLIDAENRQPFQVRIGDSTAVSSPLGHISIPRLKDSSYRLFVQFDNHAVREQVFLININKKDQGFSLKQQDNRRWILYNWQSHEVKNALTGVDSSRLIDQGVKRENAFSALMASVVNDSSVMYNTYKGGELSKDSARAVAGINSGKKKQDSVLVKTRPDTLAAVKTKKETAVVKNFKPSVRKLREVSLKISRKLVFLDITGPGRVDTVTLFIYFNGTDTAIAKTVIAKKDTVAVTKEPSMVKKDSVAPAVAGNCPLRAGAADLDSVRSAILIANTEADKVAAAAKTFRIRCFSSLQLRVLAGLFVDDRGRYRLLEAAYSHVWDPEHLAGLQDMFSEKQYVRKFHTLAGGK